MRAAAGCAGQTLDLDTVAIEEQDSIQVAEAAGKVVVTDERVLHFQAALQHRVRARARRVQAHTQACRAPESLGLSDVQQASY